MKKPLTVKRVEKVIGQRASKWKGNCYGIAGALVAKKLVEGVAVYGLYHGHIAKTSMFAGQPFARHGWVLAPDGTVIDPTRWVFEDVEPYIFEGHPRSHPPACLDFEVSDDEFTCVHCGHVLEEHQSGFMRPCKICIEWPYDEGANRLREMLMKPPPRPDEKVPGDGTPQFLLVSTQCNEFISVLLSNGRRPDGRLTKSQLFWLANVPYNLLGGFAHEIYSALRPLGMGSFVPIDNQQRADREKR